MRHIIIVKGNLAPKGAVLKFSGKAPRVFTGPAKVFNSERLGMEAVRHTHAPPMHPMHPITACLLVCAWLVI